MMSHSTDRSYQYRFKFVKVVLDFSHLQSPAAAGGWECARGFSAGLDQVDLEGIEVRCPIRPELPLLACLSLSKWCHCVPKTTSRAWNPLISFEAQSLMLCIG